MTTRNTASAPNLVALDQTIPLLPNWYRKLSPFIKAPVWLALAGLCFYGMILQENPIIAFPYLAGALVCVFIAGPCSCSLPVDPEPELPVTTMINRHAGIVDCGGNTLAVSDVALISAVTYRNTTSGLFPRGAVWYEFLIHLKNGKEIRICNSNEEAAWSLKKSMEKLWLNHRSNA